MTDIATRLRAWADPVEQGYEVPAAGQAMRDGADEIERLREMTSNPRYWEARYRDEAAEVDRLREALRDVLALVEHPRDIYEVDVDAIQSAAWRALK